MKADGEFRSKNKTPTYNYVRTMYVQLRHCILRIFMLRDEARISSQGCFLFFWGGWSENQKGANLVLELKWQFLGVGNNFFPGEVILWLRLCLG